MAKKKSTIELIVRRGARGRFHKLREKTEELPVSVVWDRREADRRSASTSAKPDAQADRRSADRRQRPPFTWEVSDFVVVDRAQRRKVR